jgi:RNA polymerase sigma factor (sigma-70 family)
MSPLALRRYRAERLLRDEFEGLRGRVLASVRARLRSSGVILDASDLEACYAQAWQGLYMAVLDGQEVLSPAAWLTHVTFRRAIDEKRSFTRAHRGGQQRTPSEEADGTDAGELPGAGEHDLAADLDDRMRLRQLFEALRGRLSARERQAATLCYLQGLSRAEAAARMGLSEARMRKLMEGQGAGRPGVAGKVGALVATIRRGDWCDEQGSLMRGFAYGVLDPEGERYQLALIHHEQCPACRAYVLSLRGLAAVLPPVPLPLALGAGVLAGTGARLAGAGAESTGAAGAAGGGWLVAGGGLGAKVAAGCALAVSVGAGCVALTVGIAGPTHPAHHARPRARAASSGGAYGDRGLGALGASDTTSGPAHSSSSSRSLSATARATREFGLEQPGAPAAAAAQTRRATTARSAPLGGAVPAAEEGGAVSKTAVPATAARTSGGTSAAEREFGIG